MDVKCRPRTGSIPSLLHTPALLRYYHPILRTVLEKINFLYQAVLTLALVFYVANLFSAMPDLSESSLLHQSFITMSGTPYWCGASTVKMIGCCFVGVTFAPFFLATAFPILCGVLGIALAQHYLHVMLSLTLLQHLESAVRLVRTTIKTARTMKIMVVDPFQNTKRGPGKTEIAAKKMD